MPFALKFKGEKCTLLQREARLFRRRPDVKLRAPACAKDACLHASRSSPSKATCTSTEAILFGTTKENGLLSGEEFFKNGKADVPFQVQFSPATVFATYHSAVRATSEQLNGGSRAKI